MNSEIIAFIKPPFVRFFLISFLFGFALLIYALFIEPQRLNIRTIKVESPYWTQKPIKIALLTDLHIDEFHNNSKRITKIIDKTLELNPDIVFLGGDYVGGMFSETHPPKSKYENRSSKANSQLESAIFQLGALSKAPLGAYAIMGNHDCWWSCEKTRQAFSKTPIHFLENQNIQVENNGFDFYVVGLEDRQTQNPNYELASKNIIPTSNILTLEHNPSFFKPQFSDAKIMFSGHTHGGQVRFPIIGAPITSSSFTEETMKGFAIIKDRILIISSGLGEVGLPIRFGVPPEIMIIELKNGKIISAK